MSMTPAERTAHDALTAAHVREAAPRLDVWRLFSDAHVLGYAVRATIVATHDGYVHLGVGSAAELNSDPTAELTAEEARTVAQWLIAAADKLDRRASYQRELNGQERDELLTHRFRTPPPDDNAAWE